MECTWDKDEDLQRSRHLSNISSWRNLHDSDLQQYLADSNSDDSEQSGNEEAQGKRKDMRKMLLGDDSDGSFGDDFFAADNDGEDLGGGDMGAMSYSFVPEEKEDKRAQEMKKRMEEGLVFSCCLCFFGKCAVVIDYATTGNTSGGGDASKGGEARPTDAK